MADETLDEILQSWRLLLGAPNLVWLPRLTAGIYALTRALDLKAVIIPNNCCLAVVYGILLGGAKPVFCEVNLEDSSLNVDACRQLLQSTDAKMVIHVHSYGIYSDREPIHQLCKEYGAFYFEDGACWFPPPGYKLLDTSCLGLSFGRTKIFELGGGGILCFTDGSLAQKVQRIVDTLPQFSDMIEGYNKTYDELVAWDGLPRSKHPQFSLLAESFKALWIGSSGYHARAPDPSLIKQEKHRRDELTRNFSDIVSDYHATMFRQHALNFTWRFSFLSRDRWLVNDLFGANGFFVSRWYPPLDRFFPNYERSHSLKNSYRLGKELFNIALPLDLTVEQIRSATQIYRNRPWKKRIITLAKPILGPVRDGFRRRDVNKKK